MPAVSMPKWNGNGIIPPVDPINPVSAERSPYKVNLIDFILRFSITPERCKILKGYMDYRAALHAAGITEGFQWLNGSFLEQVEITENRSPNDIDVVTLYRLSSGSSEADILNNNSLLFPITAPEKKALKDTFCVDAYYVSLGSQSEVLLENGTYWYGMWSHKRDYTWKGFAQVDLDPANDSAAMQTLMQTTHMRAI